MFRFNGGDAHPLSGRSDILRAHRFVFWFFMSGGFDDYALLFAKIHAFPAFSRWVETSFHVGWTTIFATGTALCGAALSKTGKNRRNLLLDAHLFKLPANFFADIQESLDSPQSLIYDNYLTPYEDKDEGEKQKIDDPKKF
ncbi:MAG: hypothetical protein LBU70_00665 [Chitinispirillales bacterium]|jgi:hypothetical protein|nr:hypothetical protein [Chitinispirillales bacterium]